MWYPCCFIAHSYSPCQGCAACAAPWAARSADARLVRPRRNRARRPCGAAEGDESKAGETRFRPANDDFAWPAAGCRDGFPRPPRLCCCLPGRHFDPPHRRRPDAGRAVNPGAPIAPVTRPENLQRLPKTKARGETDASAACALAAPAWRVACHPAPRRISQVSLSRVCRSNALTSMRTARADVDPHDRSARPRMLEIRRVDLAAGEEIPEGCEKARNDCGLWYQNHNTTPVSTVA
jgi:hypothetical protein